MSLYDHAFMFMHITRTKYIQRTNAYLCLLSNNVGCDTSSPPACGYIQICDI